MYSDYLTAACEAARLAGNYIVSAKPDDFRRTIEEKSRNDFVSLVDQTAEQLITESLLTAFPEHRVLGEEFGGEMPGSNEYSWVVDPLDGTTNFLRGIPHYAVSIALVQADRPIVGCVYDPWKKELFSATDGGGAFLNKERIMCSDRASLAGGLYATGVPFSGTTLANLDCFTHSMESILAKHTSGIRRLGSAALDLAYVAAGRYDGFWEANLNIWDIAAGVLLVQEAGGVVSELNGKADFLHSGHILATAAGPYNELLEITTTAYRHWRT